MSCFPNSCRRILFSDMMGQIKLPVKVRSSTAPVLNADISITFVARQSTLLFRSCNHRATFGSGGHHMLIVTSSHQTQL